MSETFTQVLASATRHENQLELSVPESWQQGRATFGGLTAAICLEAARPLAEGRPVRSAQITFIGPASGVLTATPSAVRVGKNTAFVSVELSNDLGVAATAMIVFGNPRESQHQAQNFVAPDVPDADKSGQFIRPEGSKYRGYSANFDTRPAAIGDQQILGNADYDGHLKMWVRHADPDQSVDAVSVFALGDVPPPAALLSLKAPAPVSSMTWMAEFLVDDFATTDGWFLAHHIDQFAANGYSSQAMMLYNADRQPVLVGRQSITIFG